MNYQTKIAKTLHEGDGEALFSIVINYYADFFRYSLKVTGDSYLSKDIIHQFVLHIWAKKSKLAHVDNIEAYLFVSFKRFLLQEMRQVSKTQPIDLKYHDGEEYSKEEFIIMHEQNEQLRQVLSAAIEMLPQRQKELLRLRYYEQMTFEDISQKTSLSLRTIYNNLYEALKHLRSHPMLKNTHINSF